MESQKLTGMRDVVGEMLAELGEEISNLVVVTADVGKPTRVFNFSQRFPDRYYNVGIAEQHMINFAAGLASAGALPVVAGFAIFIQRAWEQIRNTVARMNLNVKIVATHAGYSDHADGSSHQALEDIALMRAIPNMNVIVPADVADIRRSFRAVVASVKGPVYYRIGRDYAPPVTEGYDYEFVLGRAYTLREGSDVAIIGAGPILYEALIAADTLRSMGISASVINLLTVKPIDAESIERAARVTGHIVTVEEHVVYGGVGSAVAEIISERYPVPIRFVGAKTFGRSARSVKELLEHFNLDSKAIVRACLEVVKHGDRRA
ncbi:MAG: transketolase family protein [Ignisphaera sp.]|nr:transketolase family protein [Ignisphaera sp.]MCX8167566.1 transketolase family protein [Ignisphaera sp.]MDW8086033.1 transketolase C-terminal domain-containing protein [Ignisphaera sp.]